MPRNKERLGNLMSQPIPLPAQYAMRDEVKIERAAHRASPIRDKVARLGALLAALESSPSRFPEARAKLVEDTRVNLAEAEIELEFLNLDACA